MLPRTLVIALSVFHVGAIAAQQDRTPSAAPGPYAVGYRTIDHWDRTRRRAPARDFENRPNTGELVVPMQIHVWYPAASDGSRMRLGAYWAISAKSETLGPVSDADVRNTSAAISASTRFLLGAPLPTETADSLRDAAVRAIRIAPAAGGRFPLVVGGLHGAVPAHGIGEYLASHGYVVATMAGGSAAASQEVNRRAMALETYTRNIETVHAIVSDLPFVDPERTAVIGSGYQGLATINYQMRNMNALALVTLDGQELQAGSARVLRESPWFDPARVRVPYLSFGQDNAPPQFMFSDSLPRTLKYAERSAYVVRGMEHFHLISNALVYPGISADVRAGYDFVWGTVRAFLDAHVKGDATARADLAHSPVERGVPTARIRTAYQEAALPPIPTAEEVERIAMTGDVGRLRAIYRAAVARDSTVRFFTPAESSLFAFRFGQRGEHNIAVDLQQLAVEAFPRSTAAANGLGNALRDAGLTARAIEVWEGALALIDGDPDLAPEERAPSRTVIRQKIDRLRAPP